MFTQDYAKNYRENLIQEAKNLSNNEVYYEYEKSMLLENSNKKECATRIKSKKWFQWRIH